MLGGVIGGMGVRTRVEAFRSVQQVQAGTVFGLLKARTVTLK